MGSIKTPSKKGRSPAKDRHSPSKTLKVEQSPASSAGTGSPEKKETPRDATYSHRLPTEEQRKGNGRVPGRSLIMWGRPRMAEKLLLHIHYECSRHRINIPWDAIAHRLHPGSSGAAVMQHVNRLRKELLSEGHLVPPVAQKSSSSGSQADPNIRGYVRKELDGDDQETTRAVKFDEKWEDPRHNLPGSFDDNDEEQQAYNEMDAAPSEEDVEIPDTPTPIRRVPRGPISIPQYNMRPVPNPASRDGIANPGFTLGNNEVTPPRDANVFATPRGPTWYDTADEYYPFDERPLFTHGGYSEGRHGVKRRAALHEPIDSRFRGYPYYHHPPHDGIFHPGLYGVGPHGPHDYPHHPMGPSMPPRTPYHGFDRRDTRAPSTPKDQETTPTQPKAMPPTEKHEILKSEPESAKRVCVEELPVSNASSPKRQAADGRNLSEDGAINPELRASN